MIHKYFFHHLIFIFLVSSLQGGLHSFCGTWLRCNFLEWNGAPKRRPRGPAKRGSGSVGDAATSFTYWGRPHPASGPHLPTEGTAPPCAVAFRVVAPCSAPQKPHTPPCPTAGFRLTESLALKPHGVLWSYFSRDLFRKLAIVSMIRIQALHLPE